MWVYGQVYINQMKVNELTTFQRLAAYVKENYDRINVNLPKGKKELVQAHAEAQGESLNGFINRAITETMERDNAATESANG